MATSKFGFYEFFAGGGMARLGLGSRWRSLFANDFSAKKVQAYRTNFPPARELIEDDVYNLRTSDLPGKAAMAWASFPCQDLSLAGKQRGLIGERSGSFWGFWRLMQGLELENRSVPIIVLENVVGTITANQGEDFRVLLETLVEAGYYVGSLVINAVHFVPQSRPRLFIIAVKRDRQLPKALRTELPSDLWHPTALCRVYNQLSKHLQEAWVWWHLPKPGLRKSVLINLIEENPDSVSWHTATETQRLLDLMMPLHKEKVEKAKKQNTRMVGTIYRRIRINEDGVKAQCAEIRFDQVSGCLRTGSGGSSRQFIMIVEGQHIRSRLLSTREAARLMGVPDSYKLPQGYNEAYHLMGDGLVVPAISWLEKHLLSPLAAISLDFPNETGLADEHVAYAIPAHNIQYRLLERVASK